jgi:hypothetical protein
MFVCFTYFANDSQNRLVRQPLLAAVTFILLEGYPPPQQGADSQASGSPKQYLSRAEHYRGNLEVCRVFMLNFGNSGPHAGDGSCPHGVPFRTICRLLSWIDGPEIQKRDELRLITSHACRFLAQRGFYFLLRRMVILMRHSRPASQEREHRRSSEHHDEHPNDVMGRNKGHLDSDGHRHKAHLGKAAGRVGQEQRDLAIG